MIKLNKIMKMKNFNVYTVLFSVFVCGLFCLATSCSNNGELDNLEYPKLDAIRGIKFLEEPVPYSDKEPEIIYVDASEQTVTIHPIPVFDDMPVIEKLFVLMLYPIKGNDYSDWEYCLPSEIPSDFLTNQIGDFYHVWVDKEDGKPVIKIDFKANASGEERAIQIEVTAGLKYENRGVFGRVAIVQKPSVEPVTLSLKAKFKDKIYSTDGVIDEKGNHIYYDADYNHLMEKLDSNPSIQMMVADNSLIYYYDADDIAHNRPYYDIMELENQYKVLPDSGTRASGFEGEASTDLGYFALYDNDHFGGKSIIKGIAHFDSTYNIPSLKWFGMNDKVTSIAVAYNGTDPLVCSVLTIWDDSDYNHGDHDRKKHRISIVASKFYPRVTREDLKKIKKIGSSKSWNDCISSISCHFGYIDCLLLDY